MSSAKKPAIIAVPWNGIDVAVVIALSLVAPAALMLTLGLLKGFLPPANSLYSFLVDTKPLSQSVYYLVTVAIEFGLLVWVARKYHAKKADFGLKRFDFWRALRTIALFYIVLFVAVFLVFSLIRALLPNLNVDQTQVTGFENASLWWEKTLGFIIIVIIAPIIEELFFRGFVFAGLIARFGPVAAAVLSSVIFGVLHFQTNVSIYTFILALLLCLLYYRSKSIIPGIGLHMLNNVIAYAVLFKLI